MKEDDIRPTGLFGEYLRLSAEDAKHYFAEEQQRLARDCPGCGGGTNKAAFKKNGFQMVNCTDCGTLFANPGPAPDRLAEFYRDSPSQKYWANTFFPAVAAARQEKIFRPKATAIAELFDQYAPKDGKVIDVGAGAGLMLEELRGAGIGRVFAAVEPTPELARQCRDKGFETLEGFAEHAAEEQNFAATAALVMSFEVIEHVVSPRAFLDDMTAMAQPGGLILVTGLCGSGFDIQILGKSSNSVSPPHHLNFLTRQGVTHLLRRCGLEKISFTTPGALDVDIVKAALEKDPNAFDDGFLKEMLIENDEQTLKNFQKFLTSSNLSSHMWILARKPE